MNNEACSIRSIDIGRSVTYQALETALLKAAKEVGWRVKVKESNYIEIFLRGMFFPAMQITIHDKKPTGSFLIWTGCDWGYASDRKVQRYLDIVTKNLS
jgi:hypothetical protein